MMTTTATTTADGEEFTDNDDDDDDEDVDDFNDASTPPPQRMGYHRPQQRHDAPTSCQRTTQTDDDDSGLAAARRVETGSDAAWMEDDGVREGGDVGGGGGGGGGGTRRQFTPLMHASTTRRLLHTAYDEDTSVTTTSQWLEMLNISPSRAPRYFTHMPPEASLLISGAGSGSALLSHSQPRRALCTADGTSEYDQVGGGLKFNSARGSGAIMHSYNSRRSTQLMKDSSAEMVDSRSAEEMFMRETDERLEALSRSTDFVVERASYLK